MAMLKPIGSWMNGSSWTAAMTCAQVTSKGWADAFDKKRSHTSRVLWAHQVTAATLYEEDIVQFPQWWDSMAEKHHQFYY
jgi:hypothetical protein